MPNVTVPAEFFRAELRVYSDWREALARELLQNALDAGARTVTIDVTAAVDPDGQLCSRVTFTDDGHGMTSQVLTDVFFALGATTKTSADSIGGFGRARIICCFAQRHYTIRTGALLVTGTGGHYIISDRTEDGTDPLTGLPALLPHVSGCTFTIDTLDQDPAQLTRAFERLLAASDVPATVTLNGSPGPASRTAVRASRVLRQPDSPEGPEWAKVFVQPGSGRVRIRVRGLLSYTRWTAGNDDVIVELTPRMARTALTAGREGLRDPYARQLDAFLSNLSSNRRAALRPPTGPIHQRITDQGFAVARHAAQPTASASPGGSAQDAPAVVTAAEREAAGIASSSSQPLPEHRSGGGEVAHTTLLRATAPIGVGCDVHLFADSSEPAVRRSMRSWDPQRWTPQSRKHAVLRAWHAAVRCALDEVLAATGETEIAYAVGFTFAENVRGLHRFCDGGHVLAVNPVTVTGGAVRVGDRAHRRQLLAVAAHEACHVIYERHDESFAALLTDVVGSLDWAAADRAVLSAVRAQRSAVLPSQTD